MSGLEHINTEQKKVSVRKLPDDFFDGQYILVIHDDPRPKGTGTQAPMLLDSGTVDWLLNILHGIKSGALSEARDG